MAKLTQLQYELLPLVELNPHVSVSELARTLRQRTHVIQYALARLRNDRILRPSPLIDGARLGFLEFTVLMNLVQPTGEARSRFTKELLRSNRVTWVAELGGDYRFCAAVNAKNAQELVGILEGVLLRARVSLHAKQVAVVESFISFPRKYLNPRRSPNRSLGFGKQPGPVAIDDRDHLILGGLLSNNYQSHRDLASQLGIALSSMELRIKKLSEIGVIAGFRYVIASHAIGAQFAQIKVVAPSLDPKLTREVLDWARQHPNVLMFHRLFGAWDYELGVEVHELGQLPPIVDAFTVQFGERISAISILPLLIEHTPSAYPFAQLNSNSGERH